MNPFGDVSRILSKLEGRLSGGSASKGLLSAGRNFYKKPACTYERRTIDLCGHRIPAMAPEYTYRTAHNMWDPVYPQVRLSLMHSIGI